MQNLQEKHVGFVTHQHPHCFTSNKLSESHHHTMASYLLSTPLDETPLRDLITQKGIMFEIILKIKSDIH